MGRSFKGRATGPCVPKDLVASHLTKIATAIARQEHVDSLWSSAHPSKVRICCKAADEMRAVLDGKLDNLAAYDESVLALVDDWRWDLCRFVNTPTPVTLNHLTAALQVCIAPGYAPPAVRLSLILVGDTKAGGIERHIGHGRFGLTDHERDERQLMTAQRRFRKTVRQALAI